MDDYSITSLNESKNEWCARLVNILTPCIFDGFKSIFNEAVKLCNDNNEEEKYLMTFQTFLGRIPNWNKNMIIEEKKRIVDISNCGYLEDLITCVHIIQLKALSCVRVGTKQKKIDIDVPSIDDFIHKIYIFSARKIYTNIYLFENNITPLSIQKNNRELENIIKECILNAIRDSIPVELLLRAYMDETQEEDVEIKEEIIKKEDDVKDNDVKDNDVKDNDVKDIDVKDNDVKDNDVKDNDLHRETTLYKNNLPDVNKNPINNIIKTNKIIDEDRNIDRNTITSNINETLSFSDIDKSIDTKGYEEDLNAPKNVDYLENMAKQKSLSEEYEDEDEDEDDDDLITIGDNVNLDVTDINDLNDKDSLKLNDLVLNDIEILT
tara:strand:- start:3277 stop:4413 length:1137 start_codon:yes stop_codon:yes gene_type:complete